jgi:hypothetical protein
MGVGKRNERGSGSEQRYLSTGTEATVAQQSAVHRFDARLVHPQCMLPSSVVSSVPQKIDISYCSFHNEEY